MNEVYAPKQRQLLRMWQASITQAAFNNDYDFEGVSTVNVYSVATSPLNNYQMSGQ